MGLLKNRLNKGYAAGGLVEDEEKKRRGPLGNQPQATQDYQAALAAAGPSRTSVPFIGQMEEKMRDAYKQGGFGAGAATAIREGFNAPRALIGEPIANAVGPTLKSVAEGVSQFGKTLVTGDPSRTSAVATQNSRELNRMGPVSGPTVAAAPAYDPGPDLSPVPSVGLSQPVSQPPTQIPSVRRPTGLEGQELPGRSMVDPASAANVETEALQRGQMVAYGSPSTDGGREPQYNRQIIQGLQLPQLPDQVGSPAVTPSAPSAPQQAPRGREQLIDALFTPLLKQESNNNQAAVSPKGATGIAQIMPATGPEAAKLAGVPWDPTRFKNDAQYNAALGRAYLTKQMSDFGDDPAKALAAYNAGPGALRKAIAKADKNGDGASWLDYLPAETRAYVPKILGNSGLQGQPQVSSYGLSANGAPAETAPAGTPVKREVDVIKGMQRGNYDLNTRSWSPNLPADTPASMRTAAGLTANGVAPGLVQQYLQTQGIAERDEATRKAADVKDSKSLTGLFTAEVTKQIDAAETPAERLALLTKAVRKSEGKVLMETRMQKTYDANGMVTGEEPYTVIADGQDGRILYQTPTGGASAKGGERPGKYVGERVSDKAGNVRVWDGQKWNAPKEEKKGYAEGGMVEEEDAIASPLAPEPLIQGLALGAGGVAAGALPSVYSGASGPSASLAAGTVDVMSPQGLQWNAPRYVGPTIEQTQAQGRATFDQQVEDYQLKYASARGKRQRRGLRREAVADGLAFAQGGAIPSVYAPSAGMPPPGGVVQGPGTGTSDSIPARVNGQGEVALSAGEHIMTAAAVKKYGAKFFDQLNNAAAGGK